MAIRRGSALSLPPASAPSTLLSPYPESPNATPEPPVKPAGPARFSERCRHVLKSGWSRGGWTKWAAAFPLALLAAGAGVVLAGHAGLPGMSRTILTRLMMVEFLAIHSGAFLGFFFFWRPSDRKNTVAKWVIFCVILGLYCAAAFNVGRDLFVMFVIGSGLPYLGMMLARDRASLRQMWARWTWSFLAFMAASGPTGTPGSVNQWTDRQSVVWACLIYFTLLALAELSGIYYTREPDWRQLIGESDPAD